MAAGNDAKVHNLIRFPFMIKMEILFNDLIIQMMKMLEILLMLLSIQVVTQQYLEISIDFIFIILIKKEINGKK